MGIGVVENWIAVNTIKLFPTTACPRVLYSSYMRATCQKLWHIKVQFNVVEHSHTIKNYKLLLPQQLLLFKITCSYLKKNAKPQSYDVREN